MWGQTIGNIDERPKDQNSNPWAFPEGDVRMVSWADDGGAAKSRFLRDGALSHGASARRRRI